MTIGIDIGGKGLLGLVMLVVASVVYYDFVRTRIRGFRRFLAFWLGFPFTLCIKLGVPPEPAAFPESWSAWEPDALPAPRNDDLTDVERGILREAVRTHGGSGRDDVD